MPMQPSSPKKHYTQVQLIRLAHVYYSWSNATHGPGLEISVTGKQVDRRTKRTVQNSRFNVHAQQTRNKSARTRATKKQTANNATPKHCLQLHETLLAQ